MRGSVSSSIGTALPAQGENSLVNERENYRETEKDKDELNAMMHEQFPTLAEAMGKGKNKADESRPPTETNPRNRDARTTTVDNSMKSATMTSVVQLQNPLGVNDDETFEVEENASQLNYSEGTQETDEEGELEHRSKPLADDRKSECEVTVAVVVFRATKNTSDHLAVGERESTVGVWKRLADGRPGRELTAPPHLEELANEPVVLIADDPALMGTIPDVPNRNYGTGWWLNKSEDGEMEEKKHPPDQGVSGDTFTIHSLLEPRQEEIMADAKGEQS
ncbi:hypothetical protein R1sor_002756 [Riccia sorocarpa]|uniref:Uncharacterized protein n=1 Tax=Riccia sorocarpa TaxID=122646 RepID=A0ABD3H2E5_9MARC